MGCTDRPDPTNEELAYEKRKRAVIRAIKALPLSRLTVGDCLNIVGAFFHRHFGLGPVDVEMLEELLKRVERF